MRGFFYGELMSFFLSPVGNEQQFDANGNPLVGGKIYTYIAGSSTPVATYTDNSTGTQQANPIILNSLGLPASPIWLTNSVSVKFIIRDSADVLIRTIDNLAGINDVTAAASEWVASSITPTYISSTSFSMAGDQTQAFQVGRRILTTNTAGTRYSSIISSVFTTGVTTVTVVNDSGTLDSGLSNVAYGLLSQSNPSIPARLPYVTAINGGQLAGMRNKVINGRFEVWQGGTSFSCPAATETYCADQWIVVPTGATCVVSRTAFSTASGAIRYAMQAAGAASLTSIEYVQRIEAANSFDLASKTITVTATLYQNSGSNWTGCLARIFRANTADTFSGITQEGSTQPFALANNTATKFTWQFTLSASATTGIELVIDTLNAQPAGTGFAITEVQLELGSASTPFEQRANVLELSLCQRYTRPISAFSYYGQCTSTTNGVVAAGGVPMRITPTLSTTAGFQAAQANGTGVSVTPAVNTNGADGVVSLALSGGSGLVAGNATYLTTVPAGALLTARL